MGNQVLGEGRKRQREMNVIFPLSVLVYFVFVCLLILYELFSWWMILNMLD